TERDDFLLCILRWEDDPKRLRQLSRRIYETMSKRFPGCAVGVGSAAVGVQGLRRSLIEAQHACSVAALRPKGDGLTHDGVSEHTLLLALQEPQVLEAFSYAILKPLEDHDRNSHVKLVETLDRFLMSGGRWEATAAE